MLWPLRDVRTADVSITELSDGRRQIIIDHAEMNGVTPAMLAWWYGHVVGDMEYAGRTYPRYLVWHPLDHIS
jgi:DAPG hydrolase-like protein